MTWDKPFYTFEQQVQCLIEKHHLTVNNPIYAAQILEDIPYYDLINGYKDYMMTDDIFHNNISFEFLHAFYLFDRDFQNLLFKQSVLVENSFKNKIAYILADHFGVHQDDYLSEKNFYFRKRNLHYLGQNGVYNAIHKVYADPNPISKENPKTGEIERIVPKKSIPLPTGYYKKHHNHIPPWILLRNVSFSTTINLFSLMKPSEARAVISFFFPEPSEDFPYTAQVAYTLAGMNLIRKFRNTIAHDLKFVSYRPSGYERLATSTTRRLFPDVLTQAPPNAGKDFASLDVYAFILALMYFLKDHYLRLRFCTELVNFFRTPSSTNPDAQVQKVMIEHYTKLTGLPLDISDRFNAFFEKI